MRAGPLLAAALLSLAFVSGPATAGTADEPEISDPAGDVVVSSLLGAGAPNELPYAAAVDVVAAWITHEDDALAFHVRVADLSAVDQMGNEPDTDLRYGLRFELPHANLSSDVYWAYTWNAHARFTGLALGAAWAYDLWDPRVEAYVPVTGHTDIDADTIAVIVPLALLANATHGTVLTSTSADAGHYWPVYPAWFGDWSERGRDFTVPEPPAAAPRPAAPSAAPAEETPSIAPPAVAVALLALVALAAGPRRRPA